MKTNGSHLAYPSHKGFEQTHEGYDARNQVSGGGMTKRERFAMAAMQGLCAAKGEGYTNTALVAIEAVQCADALIAELNKTREV